MNKRLTIISVLVLVVLCTGGFIVYATYPIWSGQVTGKAEKAALVLTINGASSWTGSFNSNVTLAAGLSDGLAGVGVDFYANNTKIGSNVTDAGGVAVLVYNMTSTDLLVFNATAPAHP